MTTELGLPADMYGVGVISGDAPPNIQVKILTEFDAETYERYSQGIKNALAPLNRFNASLVSKNFQSYLNIQKYAYRLMSLGRDFGIPDRIRLAESVMGQIVNWLTSFRLFLDHAETNLKRQYGDHSSQYDRFKLRTGQAFDGALGYRFIYRFRNYVQHCGAPISSLTLGANQDGEGNAVSFQLDSHALLQDFDWGAIVRADLEAMEDTFELEPLAHEAMDQLNEIDGLLLDIAVEEGARTIADVREALDLIPRDAEGVRNVFHFTVDENSQIRVLTPQPFPSEDSVVIYEAVAAGTRQPSDLHAPPVPPAAPPFDPATIAQRIHNDSRAVQLMTLWQSEGGSTPVFVERVNAIIEEDGSLEPILTGFFNMTAVLIHMTAAALGVDPEGFIGGLLDAYPDQGPEEFPSPPANG
jgi:hypothetical protein